MILSSASSASPSAEIEAATRILSAEPTLVPPNFITNRSVNCSPSVGYSRANDFEQRLFHILDGEVGGIDVDRVGRLNQRRFGAGTVAGIALADLAGERLGFASRFGRAPPHALFGIGIEKDFHLGVGEDD